MSNEKILAEKIARLAADKGGRAYYVGGCVRDALIGIESGDVDVEIHGVSKDELEAIIDSVGTRLEYGKSFGIYSIAGSSLDIAMPRRERAIGSGHRSFDIEVDASLGERTAAERRDFTVNALMQDVLTGKILDFFGGTDDIKSKTLRHINDKTFVEDPLRVFRAAQFASRFGFTVSDETIALCQTIDVTPLSSERVYLELEKALTKAQKPSVFFEVLRKMNKLAPFFAELEALIGIKQNPKYHTEGDAYTHTMMVLDAAASFSNRVKNKTAFMLAAMCHDLGKAVSTEYESGSYHAYGHEEKSVELADTLLRRLTNEKALIKYVKNLTALHMKPNALAGAGASIKSTNKMFDDAIDPEALIYLGLSDGIGKLPASPSNEEFLFKRLDMFREIMARPYITGNDLLSNGIAPSDSFSEILSYSHKLRLAGVDKDSAMKQTLAYARKLNRK